MYKILHEREKQQVTDDRPYYEKLKDDAVRKRAWDELKKNLVMNGDMMVDIRTVEFLGPKVDYTRKFYINVIVFIDHKITYCRAGALQLAPWVLEVPAVFRKKSSLPPSLPCSSNSSHCSFVICLTFALFCLRITCFSLQYFSISCIIFWNSAREIFSSRIACDITSLVLFNLG